MSAFMHRSNSAMPTAPPTIRSPLSVITTALNSTHRPSESSLKPPRGLTRQRRSYHDLHWFKQRETETSYIDVVEVEDLPNDDDEHHEPQRETFDCFFSSHPTSPPPPPERRITDALPEGHGMARRLKSVLSPKVDDHQHHQKSHLEVKAPSAYHTLDSISVEAVYKALENVAKERRRSDNADQKKKEKETRSNKGFNLVRSLNASFLSPRRKFA